MDRKTDEYLRQAFQEENLEEFKLLMSQGSNPFDTYMYNTESSSIIAAHITSDDRFNEFLKASLDAYPSFVNTLVRRLPSQGMASPLHIACRFNAILNATVLLERGADPNALDEYGNTVLSKSIPRINLVQLLVKHGVDINQKSSSRMTALMNSCMLTDLEYRATAIYLLKLGADINVRTPENGYSAFDYAASDVVYNAILEHGYDPTEVGKHTNYTNSLVKAVYSSNVEKIRMLVTRYDMTVDVTITTDNGDMSLLCYAVDREKLESTRILIELGADPLLSECDKLYYLHDDLACNRLYLDYKTVFIKRKQLEEYRRETIKTIANFNALVKNKRGFTLENENMWRARYLAGLQELGLTKDVLSFDPYDPKYNDVDEPEWHEDF
jgi:hypothetical protein